MGKSDIEKERKKRQEKINAAFNDYKSRVENNLQSTFNDLQTRINTEIDAASKISTPSWGGGNEALKSSLDSTRKNRINVTKLIKEVEAKRKYLGDEKTDTLLKSLNSMKNAYSTHSNIAEVRSQFETEGDYHGYLMTNTGDKTDSNSVSVRQNAYTFVSNRVKQIDGELDNWEDEKDEKYDALVAEKERLEKYARQYERGNKYKDDIFAQNATRDDYEEKSANRDFGNSTKDEYDEFDTKAYGGYISYHDGYQSVPVEGQFPYTTSPEDAMKQMGEELAINDPLGFYFDNYGIWSEDNETNSYSPTEIMYYSPANLIAGAEYNTVLYKGDRQYWSNLTEDEIGMYYFILNDQGKDAALAFLDGMENELAYRESEDYKEYLRNASLLDKIFLNALSIPASVVGGTIALADDAIKLISGQEIDQYNAAHAMSNFANDTRSTTAEELNELTDNGSFLGMTTGDVYQAIMSGVDSLVAGGLAGPTGAGILLGNNAASSEAERLYAEGAENWQIALGAIKAGAAEMIFEKYSIENLFSLPEAKSVGQFFKNILAQGGVEFSEEVATELANSIGDVLIRTNKSDLMQSIYEYQASGLSKGEATWEALKDLGLDVWKAGASGFISGGAMSVGHTALNYAQTDSALKQEGKAILDQGGVDTLKALALDIAGEQHGIKNFASKVALERQANKVSGEVYEGKGLGGRISAAVKNSRNAKAVGRLSDTVHTTISAQSLSEITADLRKQGMSKAEATKIANEFMDVVENGGAVSEELQNAIEKSVEDGTALGETWLKALGRDSAILAKNNRYNLARNGIETDVAGEITEEGEKALTKKINDKLGITGTVETNAEKFDVNSDGENFSKKSGNAIESLTFVDTKDGIKIKVSDTETVNARDVSYKDATTAAIFSTIATLGADAKTANEIASMFSNITDENQAVYIASDMALAYKYGRMNYGDSYLTKLDSLTPQDAKIIYNKGREQAILHRKNEVAKFKSAVEKAKAEKTNSKKVGNLTLAENISTDSKSRTSKENANIMVAEIMSKLTGTEIYVGKSSLDQNGNRTWTLPDGTVVTANGLYLPGKIYLDINAGNFGEGVLLEALGHELGHHIKRYNPELFAKIADYLMEEFEKNGYDVRGMIQEEIRKIEAREARKKALAKRNGKPFKAKTEQQIEEEAQEEFVCQAFVGMLQDGTVAKSLANLKQQDYSVWKVIMDTIKDLLEKWGLITKEYEGRELSTKEGQALASMKDVFKKVQEMYIEGLKGANENFDALGTMNDNVFMLQQRHYNEANPVTGMSGRDTLYEYLENTYGTEDANNLISTIDNINNVMDEIKRDHPELNVFSQWQDTEIDIDENGHPVFTTSINNGDYELNQDFSRVCKKRRQLDFVLNLLAEDPNFEASYLTKEDFVAINNAIKEHGFEIACALCFVDSKRFRQAEWADSFANTWNDILSSLMVDGSNPTPFNFATKSANIADENINLDLSKPITLRKWSNGKVSETRKYDNIEHMLSKVEKNGKMAYIEGNSNIRTIATLIRDNPNLRHTFRGADIISSSGFDSIQKLAPEVRNILDGWGGSSVPKPSSSDASYDNSVLNIKGYNKKAAYAMGGVRMNSFSDFMAHMFFDYCEAFADLSAKQLPMQSYTKELVFARLFGKLGGKINMSGIAAVRKNTLPLTESKKDGITKDQAEKNKEIEKRFAGLDISRLMEHLQKDVSDITTEDLEQNLDLCEYLWADESIDMIKATLLQSGILYDKLSESKQAECYELLKDGKFDKAFKVAGKNNVDTDYAANIGTIVVGVSDAHIRKLLRDNTIRMVIPYHKSGLNPLIANLLKISVYDDYTDFQSTGVVLKGAKKRVNLSSKEIKDSLGLVDFNFYDYFGKTIDGVTYDGSAVADKYLDWCENGVYDAEVGDYVYYTTKDKGYILAKDLHKKLKVVPKFEQFSNELNYYKVLEDFDCYNTITGEHSPQGAVKFLEKGLPEDYKKILTDALIEEQQVQDDFRDHLDNKGLKDEIMDIISKSGYNATDGVGIGKKVSKAEYKEQARELQRKDPTTLTEKALTTLLGYKGHIKKQLKRDSKGRKLSKEQQEYFKDSKVRDKDGNLELMYHGSKEATFTIFDKAKKTVAKAFFFTNNENVAKTYAGENAKVGENVPAKEGIYKGYINASNPLVVDGTADVSGTYKRIEAEYTDNLWRVNVGNRELVLTNKQFNQFRGNLDPKSSDQAYEQISRAKRMGDNPVVILENATVRYKAPSNFADIEFKGKSMTTNEIVDYAYTKGFDSVIFDNINDFGANGTADVDSSKIVVVFASAQFKDVDNKKPTIDPDIRYSERDKAYMDAVNNGDMKTAQRMVEEAARKAGYDSPLLYHGTQAFGFTKVKTSGVEKGAEWSPFFAASKEDISATYVPYGKAREISSSMDDDAISEARENAIEERKENITDLVGEFRRLIDRYFSEWVFGQTDNSYLEGLVENANPEAGNGDGVYDVLSEIVYDTFYDYKEEFGKYEDADDWSENSPEGNEIFSKIVEIEGEKLALHRLELGEELGGIYQLYANLDNMYVVDGKGAAWNELRPEGLPKLERYGFKDVPYKTRDVAEWARDNGYDGVIFKNIRDNGAYGRTPAGDVYAFFKPESQVKSADPVTYDDNGNVIPLSERFNEDDNDIRYSDRDIKPITEAEYKELESHFGTTGNFRVAGYLLTDGKLLDFSGKHWGDTESRMRQVDHRDVQEVLDDRDNGFGAMVDMIGNGNIRLMPETGGICLAVYPNEKQRRVLSQYINYMLNTEGQIIIDYDAVGGDTVYSKEYGRTATSKQILNDIRNYFNGGRQSELMQFHTMYQERDPSTSNRSILANALESAAQNDIEKNKLAEYKKKISLIESEEQRLSEIQKQLFTKDAVEPAKRKELQFEAKQISNRINTYDRQLLNLEATTALKNVIKREKALAMKKQKQIDAEYIKQYKEKVQNDKKALVSKYQESRKKAVESRTKTAMRHKIKNVVSELNRMLLKGSKERNVKLDLQNAVASALDAINMDTIGAEERIAKLEQELLKAKTPEKIQEISRKIDNIRGQGDRMSSKLNALKRAYEKIKANDDNLPNYFTEEASLIIGQIEATAEKVGDTPLRYMSLNQLEAVHDLYNLVLTTVRNANKVFVQGKLEDLQHNASATMEELSSIRTLPEERADFGWLRSFSWNEMIPVYAFRRIGSKTFEKFFWEAIRGQNVVAQDLSEANDFAKDTREKYGYKKWDLDKVHEFKLADGRTFRVTLRHMMSIYAYSKRNQALDHMTKGGFFFNDKSTFRKKGGIIKLIKSNEVGYSIDLNTLEAIVNEMTPEQRKYVDDMQTYLTKMGDKGNEVSRVLWGIDIFKEKVYFPLKSVKDFIYQTNQTAQESSLKNDGMTKETKPGASNPIVLEAFDDVWASHVNRMSQYHGLVIPIENLNKIHNYGTWANTESMSVSTMLRARFGEAVNDYLNNFIKDLNGATSVSGASNPFFSFVGKFKKTAVAASASVVVQQPTAIARAAAVMDMKYFIGLPKAKSLSAQWSELQKYAPIAIIKEIGGFDAGAGRQATEWLNSDTRRGIDKIEGKIDDITMKGAAIGDQIGWCTIWEAVKREIKSTTDLKVGSEEFLKKAGERFTEVIVLTQVYDSTLSRSGFMRSKHDSVKMLTAFMGEPTVSINMMADATIQAKRGTITKRKAGRIIGAVYTSIILASIASSLIYGLRDDDEDESYLEKFAEALGGKLLDEINPFNMLPGIRDIISIFDGWDIERTDMAIFKDIKDAFDGLSSDNKSAWRKVEDFTGAISSIFGVPLKNVLRSARETYNAISNIFDDVTPSNVDDAFVRGVTDEKKDKSKSLYDAIINGDDARLEIYRKEYTDDKAYETAVRKALRENDSRIKVAAEARIGGDIAEYTRIVKEIKAEGFFSQDTIVASVNAEINAINKGESSSSENSATENKESSIYTMDDYFASIVGGDQATAYVVKEDIIKTDVANGKDRDEAEDNFNSKFASHVREQYEDGYISDYEAEKMLINYGGKSEQDAASKVQYWSFKQEYPDYDDLSEEAVDKYYNDVEPHGISIHVYYDYSKQRSKCKGTDKNGDGKTDSGSVKKEVLRVIDSLPITKSQKDALYYLNGWSARTIYEAPWR